MKKNMLSALVMGLFLVGCTVKKDAASNAEALSELGNWSTDCIVNESDSSLTVYEMENGTMTTAHYMYQNSVTCDALLEYKQYQQLFHRLPGYILVKERQNCICRWYGLFVSQYW